MSTIRRVIYIAAYISVFTAIASAQVSTGGAYVIEQSVTASGGGNSNVGNIYLIEGTSGQSAAGITSGGGGYAVKGGFWQPVPPTMANPNVSISGRVFAGGGRGITNARVTLSGGNLTTPIVVFTGRYGSFKFENIQSGLTYTISILSRRFTFPQSSQTISVIDNITDIFFQSN